MTKNRESDSVLSVTPTALANLSKLICFYPLPLSSGCDFSATRYRTLNSCVLSQVILA